MNPPEAVLLSPYRPPTSYAVNLNPEEAEAWLNGAFALWHPAVLALVGRAPVCASTHDHDTPREGTIYCIPAGPMLYQPDNWAELVAGANAVVFAATSDQGTTNANLQEALQSYLQRNTDKVLSPAMLGCPRELVLPFEAVGYAYSLIETLYDAASHDRMLDEAAFWADVQQAVQSVAEGNSSGVRAALKQAVEKLTYARQVLNSNNLRIIDMALRDAETLNAEWPTSLHAGLPMTVLCSAETLEDQAKKYPDRFAELRSKFHDQLPSSVDLAVGSYRERDDSQLPTESQFWNWQEAQRSIRKQFGVSLHLAGRLRTSFHPQTPSWLLHAGYKNAVLLAFDGALTPGRNAVIANWTGPDGKGMDSFARTPLDASDPLTFFNLGCSLHSAFNSDSNPTLAFRHGQHPAAIGYAQLVALADLGEACGAWTSLGQLLADSHYGDYLGQQTADDYFNDTLDDVVTNHRNTSPVSGFAAHHRARRTVDSAYTLLSLYRSLTAAGERDADILRMVEADERALELGGPTSAKALSAAAELLADRIQVKSDARPGVMVFNPCNFTRRVALELDNFGVIPVADAVKAVEVQDRKTRLVVEVPSLGYAWIPQGNFNTTAPKPKFITATNVSVRNETMEAEFDPETGAIRAVRDLRTRTNRLGMQLVFNPGSRTKARNTTMTNCGAALGEVVCEGDILNDHNEVLCTFRQRMRAWIGRPVIELRIELEPKQPITGYAWHSYIGARFAWRDRRAALFRGSHGANDRTSHARPISADYLEARLGSERTFVFTGGLAFVQKHEDRMADVILLPEGETSRSFDLLLAFDRDYPMQTAQSWITPTPIHFTSKGPPSAGISGWLAHIDLPSVLMTSMKPVAASDGFSRAVALRLQETAGYAGAAEIRFARDPNRVVLCDGNEVEGAALNLQGGAIPTEFSANELFRVKAEWI